MHYSYSYNSDSEEGIIAMILFYVIYAIFVGGLGVALYIFRSMGVYSIAKRRGLNHPWFAWVPVVDGYLLGSLSDQYQYVVKGKVKSKRKWLLGLNIAVFALYAVMMVLVINMLINLAGNAMAGFSEAKLAKMAMRAVLGMLAAGVPMIVAAIALTVIRYIALYDVYTSLDPRNNVMYTVLSILFQVTEPFFLFFNRKKDDGMPPRRAAEPVEPPVWEAPREEPEQPWVNE